MRESISLMVVSDEYMIMNQLKGIAKVNSVPVIGVRTCEAVREMNKEMAHIVIVVQTNVNASVEVVQMLKIINPNALILFVAYDSDFSLLRNMTRAGIDEFYVFPEESRLFSSRLPNIIESYARKKTGRTQSAVTGFGRGRGKTISFYSIL